MVANALKDKKPKEHRQNFIDFSLNLINTEKLTPTTREWCGLDKKEREE